MKRIMSSLTFAAVFLLAAVFPLTAVAQAPSIGVVDMDRVAEEYQHMQDLNRQFQDFQREQERQLQQRHKARLLTEEESQEFLDRSIMGAPTDEVRRRLAELESFSDERERRLHELRQKQVLTPEEQAELTRWSALYERRMSELAAFQAELQASRLAKYEELSKLIADNVDNAVKIVAGEKNLTIVLRKEAIMLGGVDITNEVLAKLNGSGTR